MEKAISGKRRATSKANGLRRRREAAAALIVILGAQTTVEYAATYIIKEPMYDSIFTGAAWVQELLNGHETRFYDALGMAKPVFLQLCHELQEHSGLQNSKHLGLAEKIAIFLWICRTGGSQRETREWFQHAPGTISMYGYSNLLDGNTEREIGFFTRYSTWSYRRLSTIATLNFLARTRYRPRFATTQTSFPSSRDVWVQLTVHTSNRLS